MKEEQHLKISLNQLKSTLSAASVQNNRNNGLLYGRNEGDSRGRKEEQEEEQLYDCEDGNYRYGGTGSQEQNNRKQHYNNMNNRRDNNYNSFSNRNNINNSNEGSLFFNKDCSDGTTDRKTLPKHRTVDYSNY